MLPLGVFVCYNSSLRQKNTLFHLNDIPDGNKKAKGRKIMPQLYDKEHHREIFSTYLNLPLLTRRHMGQYRSPSNSVHIIAAPSALRNVSSFIHMTLTLKLLVLLKKPTLTELYGNEIY